jgi:hypothetical protein
MPNKIIDEYTNRKDLTPTQKFNLRHPGKMAEYQREWSKNPGNKAKHAAYLRAYYYSDAGQMAYHKRVKANRLKRIDAFKRASQAAVKSERRVDKGLRIEVLRHHAKGRKAEDIVLWVNRPLSVIKQIIENHEKAKETQASISGHPEEVSSIDRLAGHAAGEHSAGR